MKPVLFIRKAHIITNVKTKEVQHFDSIAQAKNEAFQLQLRHDRMLGLGSVQVEK